MATARLENLAASHPFFEPGDMEMLDVYLAPDRHLVPRNDPRRRNVVRTLTLFDVVHGDEWCNGIGAELVEEQYDSKGRRCGYPGVQAVIVNPDVYLENKRQRDAYEREWWAALLEGRPLPEEPMPRRFMDTNPNTQADETEPVDPRLNREGARVPRLRAQARSRTLGVELHGNEEGFSWPLYSTNASCDVRAAAAWMGFQRAMVGSRGALCFTERNVIALDIHRMNTDLYRLILGKFMFGLVYGYRSPVADIHEFEFTGAPTVEQVEKFGMPEVMQPYETLSPDVCERLGVPYDSVALAWNKARYGERTGFVGEVVTLDPGMACSPEFAEVCWRRCVLQQLGRQAVSYQGPGPLQAVAFPANNGWPR
jgi:hypothetical protein